ncbi:MAG: ABC transporter permease [Clostridiales Family XIII bacterium]|jgi:peptide/nickel transport system permease protein|nr:ABC transporter permease [Clostridiales Family XIII bacterium]
MWKYIIKRLVVMIPVVLIITIVGFVSMDSVGDPISSYFGKGQSGGMQGHEPTPAEIERVKVALGLDKPPVVRYFLWFKNVLQGNLGYTFTGRPVSEVILERLPVSIALGLSGIIIGCLGGIILGVIMARRQYSPFDYGIGVVNYIIIAIPEVCLGLFCIVLFCTTLHWFPTFGLNSPSAIPLTGWDRFFDQAKHLVLPSLILALPTTAAWSRFQRAAYLEVMRSDYVRTARSKGLSERVVAYRHTLKNALLPISTSSGNIIMGIFGGSYIIETLFTIPGIGLLTTNAFLAFDFNLMLSTSLLTTVMGSMGLLLSDIICVIVDPRIRYE